MLARYLLVLPLGLVVRITMAARRVVDWAMHVILKLAFRRLHEHRHYIAFNIVRCASVAVMCACAHVTVRFEETLGAIGLWILGRGWNWAALVDTVPALLEWYRFGLVLEIADELVRELKLNGGRS